MKNTSNYRMSKRLKTWLALMPQTANRNEIKRMMISAELAELRFRTSRRPSAAATGSTNEQ